MCCMYLWILKSKHLCRIQFVEYAMGKVTSYGTRDRICTCKVVVCLRWLCECSAVLCSVKNLCDFGSLEIKQTILVNCNGPFPQ